MATALGTSCEENILWSYGRFARSIICDVMDFLHGVLIVVLWTFYAED